MVVVHFEEFLHHLNRPCLIAILSQCQNTAELKASADLDVQTEADSDVLVDMEAFLDLTFSYTVYKILAIFVLPHFHGLKNIVVAYIRNMKVLILSLWWFHLVVNP